MILNMLDLATLNAEKIELQKKTVNFSELVEDRVKTCRNIYLHNKKVNIKLSVDQNILIDIDPNYIRQAVDNLVINAITYSDSGEIFIRVAKEGSGAKFVISDQGIGIPREEIYDVFTPFKMGSNTESKAQGRGVGLALCKSAVEAHGGTIKAESSGKGAKFTFML
jgi:signal transduction histidine kinase